MELLRVRKRLNLAMRGHKLLKDKLEGLIKELTERLQEYKELRMRVDDVWPRIFQRFAMAGAISLFVGDYAFSRMVKGVVFVGLKISYVVLLKGFSYLSMNS